MKQIVSIILTGCLLMMSSCNPEVEIPAYIYVEQTDFIAEDLNQQGTSSSKIANIWVTVDGTDIGTYTLPALVPVIASGNTDIKIAAGIKLNGLSVQRPIYPLYTLYQQTSFLRKGMIDTIFPVFHYQSDVKIPLKEDFESAGLNFYSIEGSAALEKTQDPALLFHYPNENNNFSGIIQLPFADSVYYFEIKTIDRALPFNANSVTDCFVEMNYCFSENVEIGIYVHSSTSITRQYSICNIVGTPNLEWGKIYVNLTDIISDATANMSMTHFDIY
ncbi:MAG: hypothetical protein LBI60_04120, partial [Bacteroidales bacterium]|nr:hypothetical protein [Bacteroidales bacterium]